MSRECVLNIGGSMDGGGGGKLRTAPAQIQVEKKLCKYLQLFFDFSKSPPPPILKFFPKSVFGLQWMHALIFPLIGSTFFLISMAPLL